MSTPKHEPNRPPVDQDIEIRIRDFGNFTIAALCNFTVLVVHVGMLWFSTKAVPSTIPMPFPLRWACIVCLYLKARNTWLFQSIIAIKRTKMSDIEHEKRSRNRNSGSHSTNLEDWILANFCIIVGLSTIGFVAWYWVEVIALTIWLFLYWTCTMGGLCSLFWLLKRTIRFYQKVKAVKHEAWGIIVGVYVSRFSAKFEMVEANGVLGQFLDFVSIPFLILQFLLDKIGFYIGRGPLSGESDSHSHHRNDNDEAFYPPSVFEWQPNPVIHPHLRGEHLQSLNHDPSVAESNSDCHLMNTTGEAGRSSPEIAVDFDDDKGIPKNNQMYPGAPRYTGPATMSAILSSFACFQCTFVAKKRFELNKHVTQTHNHRFKCVYHGCGKTFGLRANFERHEATHTDRKGYGCPNPWCKTPGETFTRNDNLKRHMKLCVTS
ncbi:hypothetical protein P171DRAFT_383495, partial [Karstenula rhodostoma CBS 690.94]